MTLISETGGSPSLPALPYLPYTHKPFFYYQLLLTSPPSSLFLLFHLIPAPFLPPHWLPRPGSMNHSAPFSRLSYVFPPCSGFHLRCAFTAVDKSSHISSNSYQLLITPPDSCCWPLCMCFSFGVWFLLGFQQMGDSRSTVNWCNNPTEVSRITLHLTRLSLQKLSQLGSCLLQIHMMFSQLNPTSNVRNHTVVQVVSYCWHWL